MRLRSQFATFAAALLSLIPVAAIAQSARVNAPAPDLLRDRLARDNPIRSTNTEANMLCSSGTTRAAHSRASTTSQGICRTLQKEWTGKGVVWLTVISSAPGKEGYVTPGQENDYLAKMHAAPTAALLDPEGKIGRLYNAKTTPDMFIIDPQGKLIYTGAIDNRPTTDTGDIQGADNYISDALTAAMAGKPVAMPYTRAYGCSVKYRD